MIDTNARRLSETMRLTPIGDIAWKIIMPACREQVGGSEFVHCLNDRRAENDRHQDRQEEDNHRYGELWR